MSQSILIERGHVAGAVDFTKFCFQLGSIRMRKNEPTLFDLSVVQVDGVSGWFAPSRGDYVRFEDTRWEPRFTGMPSGLIFTGFVTNSPQYEWLGTRNGQQHWGYNLKCTSDDYVINSKRVPVRTFINKTRGFILRALIEEMFEDSEVFPFDITNILDGGIERIYRTDPAKDWTDLAAEFGRADGYVYLVLDHRVYYVPAPTEPRIGDASQVLVVDEHDPRFNPTQLGIGKVDDQIVNDLTVLGEPEPSTVCFEQFTSDGYQPSHELAYIPFGLEETQLIVDDLSSEIDESIWEEIDDPIDDYIRPFEGSLNIVGGPGVDTGEAFLRSRKGIELSGVINLRDAEIFFPPAATGRGMVGGLYTEDSCLEADLWAGWYVDLDTGRITPRGPDGLHDQWVEIDPDWHYILRRTITVDRFAGLPSPVVDPVTSQQYSEDALATSATIAWEVEQINPTDPENVITTRVSLGSMYVANPQFVLYAAIVPYDCHLVMNNIAVTRPQQIHVEVDTTPSVDGSNVWTLGKEMIQVGNALDGGRCAIEVVHNRAKLTFYSLATPVGSLAGSDMAVTTIPPKGSVVSVRYYRSDIAKARIRSTQSIMAERAKFKDDGVRQMTLSSDDVNPKPRISEECLFVARAFMADRLRTKWEGSYQFDTQENGTTALVQMIYPGDKVLCAINTPDGEISETLETTNVGIEALGKGTYRFALEFGPVNRFDDAQRELFRRRNSTLQEVLIPKRDAFDADALDVAGLSPVPDPVPPTVNVVGPDYIEVNFGAGPLLQPGITGYECRLIDSGWGHGGEVVRYQTFTRGFDRNQRHVRYFFRAYRDDVGGARSYSARSAMVRHTYPLRNTIVIAGITGSFIAAPAAPAGSPGTFQFKIPIPSDPDWSQISVRSSGDLIYVGDGVDHSTREDRVTVMLSNGAIEMDIKDITALPSFTISVLPIDVLGQEADNIFQVVHTVNK